MSEELTKLLEADKPAKKEPSPEIVNALKALREEEAETRELNKALSDLLIQNRAVLDAITLLLAKKDIVADLQISALTKLDKYLDNWV